VTTFSKWLKGFARKNRVELRAAGLALSHERFVTLRREVKEVVTLDISITCITKL